MTEHDSIKERGRALEEEYFRKRERELVERIRKAKADDAARHDIEAATGLHDADLLRELVDLGFTPDTLPLLPLVPVLQVAWAEGGVTPAERELVIKLARARGVAPDSKADIQLLVWLANRPEDAVFASAGRLINALLAVHAAPMGTLTADQLIKYCETVASVSGGIFGLGRVSFEERELLASIAKDIGSRRAG